jgi:PKD repeat protein
MNNDGRDDIVIGYGSSGVRSYSYNQTNDTWNSYSTGLPNSGSYRMNQFGDINGDGYLDIIAYLGPTGYVYLGDGNGNWIQDATFTMPSPGYFSAMRVDGDVDHDGREDIVVQAEQGSFPTYKNQLKLYSPWNEPTAISGQILKPNGGETVIAGSTRIIKWLSAIPPVEEPANVTIQISKQGLNGPWTTIVNNYPNSGFYQWMVTDGASQSCYININLTTANYTYSIVSDSNFTIVDLTPSLIVDAHGPYIGDAGQPIQFTGSVTNGIPPFIWLWNFGDGNISSMQNPLHSYNQPGAYQVILTCTDSQNQQGNDTTVAIINQSYGPVADFNFFPTNPLPNDMIQFIDLSYDSSGDIIVSWTWDFGDGNTSTLQHPTNTYSLNGSYLVNLTVTNTSIVSDTKLKTIYVGLLNVNINLNVGWNLITVPVDNGWYASDITENISGCTSVVRWDPVSQSYWIYLPGYPAFDFPLTSGQGYFVEMNTSNNLFMVGLPLTDVNVSLKTGWNLIGWYHNQDTTASSLADNISGCLSVVKWNPIEQSYWLYLPGYPAFDFVVTQGMGLFVEVNQDSYWYGQG